MAYKDILDHLFLEQKEVLTEEEFVKGLKESDVFDERNTDVFFRRYGLNGYEKQTFRELGNAYNISQSRAQQIVKKLLRRLGHPVRRRWLLGKIEGLCTNAYFQERRDREKTYALESMKTSQENVLSCFVNRGFIISTRLNNCLLNYNSALTIDELLKTPASEILKIPKLGKKGFRELKESLACCGFRLFNDRY